MTDLQPDRLAEVSDQDQLAEVKDTLRYWDQMYGQNGAVRLPPSVAAQEAARHINRAQIDWLVGQAEQVERLRGLLRRLEWADRHSEWGVLPHCPACQVMQPNPHDPDCWLAAAIRSTSGEERP